MEALAGHGIRRASDLRPDIAGRGADRLLPVLPELQDLFPDGGLRRGSTVAITSGQGATTLLLAVLAATSKAGSWCAVVGMPQLGLVAADEMGIALERLALVPHPGPQWTNVVPVLLDGFDIVVIASAGQVAASVRTQLAARARQRAGVLVPFGDWDGADLTLTPEKAVWHGLGQGKGQLRSRELTVGVRGRGSASRPRRGTIWQPDGPRRRYRRGRESPQPHRVQLPARPISRSAQKRSPAQVIPETGLSLFLGPFGHEEIVVYKLASCFIGVRRFWRDEMDTR